MPPDCVGSAWLRFMCFRVCISTIAKRPRCGPFLCKFVWWRRRCHRTQCLMTAPSLAIHHGSFATDSCFIKVYDKIIGCFMRRNAKQHLNAILPQGRYAVVESSKKTATGLEKTPIRFAKRKNSCIVYLFSETKASAGLAQLVEQWNHNPRVIGPNPIPGTI